VNYQKKLLESHRTSPVELLFYTSVFGSVFLFIIVTVFTSELFHALDFLVDHPECNLYAVLFSVFGYGGNYYSLSLLLHSNATCRDVLSVDPPRRLFSYVCGPGRCVQDSTHGGVFFLSLPQAPYHPPHCRMYVGLWLPFRPRPNKTQIKSTAGWIARQLQPNVKNR